jgi:hypothetical protein
MIQAPAPPSPPPFDPNLIFLNDGGPPAIVMIVFMALLATTVILWPVMRALARRLDGKSADPALHAEIEQLQQRLSEVDVLQQRVAELEERIDFTERMLARAQTPAALPGDAPR